MHLLLVFGIAFLLMIGGMFQFGGPGFRSGLALGVVYWILSFVSVIGLYGKLKHLVIGGIVLSGLLATQIFWAQIYPFLEGQRNIPQRIETLLKASQLLDQPPGYSYSTQSQKPFRIWRFMENYSTKRLT